MFSGSAFTLFHTLLSIAALATGAIMIVMMGKNRAPGAAALAFLVTMIATDVTGFMFPFGKLLPSHITGIISLALLAIAILAQCAFHLAGPWRAAYVVSMGLAVYLNFFVLVTQMFLKISVLHALAPNAPDNPEPPFLIAQVIVLAIFIWLIWKAVKNFRSTAS
jgi:hypothetical protein